MAAREGHHGLLEALLLAGVDPNAAMANGFTAADVARAEGDLRGAELIQVAAKFGPDAVHRRVLTVQGKWSQPDTLALSCTTLAGNVATTLEWPDAKPMSDMPSALIDAIRASGFQGLQEPLEPCTLSLLKPGGLGQSLDCQADAPSLSQQLGLLE